MLIQVHFFTSEPLVPAQAKSARTCAGSRVGSGNLEPMRPLARPNPKP